MRTTPCKGSRELLQYLDLGVSTLHSDGKLNSNQLKCMTEKHNNTNVNVQVNLKIAKLNDVTTSHSVVGTLHATTLL